MLALEALHYTANGSTIIDDLSLELPDGAILSLLGPSGSGKTSLLRLIMGLATPQKGRCQLDDSVLCENGHQGLPPDQRPIAFLFQNFTLFPHLDVKRNILIGIRQLPKTEQRARLDEVLGLLKIEDLLGRDIHDLSGGEQQRVALARTLALRPRLLLLDEPFSNLDKMTRYHLYEDIKNLIHQRELSAILSTHDQEEAFYLADQMAVMRAGKLVAHAEPHAIYDQPESEWLARFTGDVNILSPEQLSQLLVEYTDTTTQPGQRVLVRPEQFRILPGANPASATIASIAYFGHTSLLSLQTEAGLDLRVAVAGACTYTQGDLVGLALEGRPAILPAAPSA